MDRFSGTLRTNRLLIVPAMLSHPGTRSKHLGGASMLGILAHKKRCSKCGELKPFSEFSKGKFKFGLHRLCKPCNVAHVREWRKKNPDKKKAQEHKYRNNHLEDERARVRNLRSIWRRNNPEKVKEENFRYYERKKELARINYDPEKGREKNENRRARRLAAGGNITRSEWLSVLKKYGHKCLWCGRTDARLTMDHVVPLDKGGSHTINNIQPLCSSCNSRKGIKIMDFRHG